MSGIQSESSLHPALQLPSQAEVEALLVEFEIKYKESEAIWERAHTLDWVKLNTPVTI